jgi:intracellular multiplication protein IcmW
MYYLISTDLNLGSCGGWLEGLHSLACCKISFHTYRTQKVRCVHTNSIGLIMPSLSNKKAHEFWNDYRDPTIYRVVSFMESAEDWTLDGDDKLEQSLTQLGEALDDLGRIDLQQEDKFVSFLAYIKTARMLYIMQTLDTAYPGAASKILMHAEQTTTSNDDVYGFFIRRNMIFERLRLLTRVFAPERLALVTKVLEGGGSHD